MSTRKTISSPGPQLPVYSSLLDRKTVVLSSRTGYIAVDQFMFFDLMAHRLADVPVDEDWYIQTYPDVREALAAGVISSAAKHYARFGYFENRMPRKIIVDVAWYTEAHPDVREAIGNQLYISAQNHYELAGFREGRLPYAGFDLFVDRISA